MQSEASAPSHLLSSRLREATQSVHTMVEGADFIKKLFQGSCTHSEYYLYLWSFQKIYESLEAALSENLNHPAISPIFFQEILRLSALNEDLKGWSSHRSEVSDEIQGAVSKYQNYLLQLAKSNPELLVAHAYVRYLGDLSGGQVFAKVLSRRFPETNFFNFYAFPDSNVADLKKSFRDGLDQVGVLLTDHGKFCEEAITAFQFNGDVFRALGVSARTGA
ncbi:MAG: biliverdin-producing heme oxygenase [Pseudobdellovibrionaceae bacterium]